MDECLNKTAFDVAARISFLNARKFNRDVHGNWIVTSPNGSTCIKRLIWWIDPYK
jgi:hypothetical protein